LRRTSGRTCGLFARNEVDGFVGRGLALSTSTLGVCVVASAVLPMAAPTAPLSASSILMVGRLAAAPSAAVVPGLGAATIQQAPRALSGDWTADTRQSWTGDDGQPRVQFNFMSAEGDRARLRRGFRFIREFFGTRPASDLAALEIAPGAEAQGDEAIDAWLRASLISAGHPVGTCAMGSVVGSRRLCKGGAGQGQCRGGNEG